MLWSYKHTRLTWYWYELMQRISILRIAHNRGGFQVTHTSMWKLSDLQYKLLVIPNVTCPSRWGFCTNSAFILTSTIIHIQLTNLEIKYIAQILSLYPPKKKMKPCTCWKMAHSTFIRGHFQTIFLKISIIMMLRGEGVKAMTLLLVWTLNCVYIL